MLSTAKHCHPSSPCPAPGFVLVKKVPGALHFVARAPGHSFDYLNMNLSHQVGCMGCFCPDRASLIVCGSCVHWKTNAAVRQAGDSLEINHCLHTLIAGALHVLWQQAQPSVRLSWISISGWPQSLHVPPTLPRSPPDAGPASSPNPTLFQAARSAEVHAPAGPDGRLVGQAQGSLLLPRVQRHHLRALPAGGVVGSTTCRRGQEVARC